MRYPLHTIPPFLPISRIPRPAALGFVALIAAFCLLCVPAAAHAPTGMALAYNETAGELAVTITHQVDNPVSHYVREVVVSADGQAQKTIPYTSQPPAPTFTYSYPLQVRAGDRVKVDASCILGGSITRTLVVPGSAGSAPVAPDLQVPATRAAAGMIPFLGLALMLVWRRFG